MDLTTAITISLRQTVREQESLLKLSEKFLMLKHRALNGCQHERASRKYKHYASFSDAMSGANVEYF